ncbi:hypothetical protein M514_11669 [Trichuris suis]|uniref:CobQ/CobB/MinD/ParA nucleotide binding domain-containing protein n=1 Tax=Trichuris suis TaxID=68888 RepID=A0A085MTT1_9BILA|nr:hypothetical protein M514_11669 [Trichuris suis]
MRKNHFMLDKSTFCRNTFFCQSHPAIMNNVNRVVLVLSGKGGVGKSTIATQLALRLSQDKRVGILDADLCGPSVPKLLGLQGKQVHQSSGGWVPVYTDSSKRLAVMSIGFLLSNEDDAAVSMDDVRREITFCSKANIPVIGLIENMSGYVCPHCSECTNIFSSGSGEQLCSYAGIPFLGRLPIDPKLSEAMELGQSYCLLNPDSEVALLLSHISEKLDLMQNHETSNT